MGGVRCSMQVVIEPVSVANRNVLWTGQENVPADYLQKFDIAELELEDRKIDFFCVIEVNDACIVGFELGTSLCISHITKESIKEGRLLAREACLLYKELHLVLLKANSQKKPARRR